MDLTEPDYRPGFYREVLRRAHIEPDEVMASGKLTAEDRSPLPRLTDASHEELNPLVGKPECPEKTTTFGLRLVETHIHRVQW
jgi:hypothetical protein